MPMTQTTHWGQKCFYSHLLTDTVSDSGEDAHGQMASGRSPLLWKTAKNWSQEESDQGFAPSATKRSRSDCRFTSLWSLVASKPQWRSRDLTIAILAIKEKKVRWDLRWEGEIFSLKPFKSNIRKNRLIITILPIQLAKLILHLTIGLIRGFSVLPLNFVIICIQDAGFTFITE